MSATVISAFPGCGKSTYFTQWSKYSPIDTVWERNERILDSDSSLFSWIYDENGNKTDVRNPEFPENYIRHIKEHLETEDIIFVSSHKIVREALEREGIKYVLIYPSKDMKTRWMSRFENRGNTAEFITFQNDHWDQFINEMNAETFPRKVVLDNHDVNWDVISVTVMNHIMDYCEK